MMPALLRRHWPIALFLLAMAISMAVQLPMSLLLRPHAASAMPGVAAEEIRGSAWRARALGVHWQARRWPEMRFRLVPASVFRGKPELRYQRPANAPGTVADDAR